MSDIPHYLVVGRIVYVVESHRELNDAEARSQMTRVARTALDDIASQLGAIVAQLRHGQPFQIGRCIDRI